MIKGGVKINCPDIQYVRVLVASYYKGYDTVGSRAYIIEIYEK